MALDKIQIARKAAPSTEDVERLHNFYRVEWSGNTVKGLQLDRLKMIEILRSMGYLRYDHDDGTSQYVHVADNKIDLTTEQRIKDAFEDYVLDLPPRTWTREAPDGTATQVSVTARMLQEQLYRNMQSYFSCLDRLRPERPIELVADTRDTKYFFFDNTAVAVTAQGVRPVPYADLRGQLWQAGIIPRPFDYDPAKGDFEQFAEDICGGDPRRKLSLMTILGYLMHDFYECDLRAAFFTDVNKDDGGRPAGRTGKGLLGKALGQMLNRRPSDNRYCAIGGKTIDLKKDTRYALADMTTQLIHIEDLARGFNLNDMYNDITDGATIRKPYQVRPIVRPVKIMLSINHTIDLKGSSDRGRVIIFELANYYSDRFRPETKFGRRFFESDWRAEDWNRFYSFMCRCAMAYLRDGLQEPEEINYSERRLQESVNEDFRCWFELFLAPHMESRATAKLDKNDVFNQFVHRYPAYDDKKSRRSFTYWCRNFFDLKHIPYLEYRSTADLFIIYPSKEDFLKYKK